MTTRQSIESQAATAGTLPLQFRWPQPGMNSPHPRRADFGRRVTSAHEDTGFALGWDYAHYRSTPPAALAQKPSALRNGLLAGQAVFGLRTLVASRHVRTWLQLRLHAWQRGRSVEVVQVTPNYLQQIDVSHCPITRERLGTAPAEPLSEASVDRVRNDAGYAAGNLAVMSRRANLAKAAHGFHGAMEKVNPPESLETMAPVEMTPAPPTTPATDSAELPSTTPATPATPAGASLNRAEWARVATLCSFVEPLTHAQACALPMLLLPPNRLRLFNPVQALQAFVSLQLLKPGWARRVRCFTELLPGAALQRDFRSFFLSLLPRVLEAGKLSGQLETRWAIEDAWLTLRVQQRWNRFALQLDAAQCEALLARAAAQHLATALIQPLTQVGATDGWNLANAGYLAGYLNASDSSV